MDDKLSEKNGQIGHLINNDDRVMHGKKTDDSKKIRSLTRRVQNQIKQASKRDIMNGSTSRRCSVLFFARDIIFIYLILVVSLLSIYNFWFTHNYWNLIRQGNILKPDSRALWNFKNVPMENLRLCITIFNYTNVDEYNLNSSVPFKVENLGPFCFRDLPDKKNIVFNKNETEISYQENSSVEFLPKESNGTLDDVIVVPNIPLLSVFQQILEHSFVVQFAVVTKIKLNKYEPFLTLKVSDFLFGYDDELLEWIYTMGQTIGYEGFLRRFSLLDRIMNNINANYTLDTGKDDISKLGDIKSYLDKPSLDVWKTPECNSFYGSYGAYWSPENVRAERNMSFFNSYLCRNVPLVKEKDTKYEKFISVARYRPAPDLFTYSSDPEHSCYCLTEEPCTDNLINLGDCLGGPFVLSYKNFYGVNRSMLPHIDFEKLKTPKPEDDDWRTYFDIHPGLGNTLSFQSSFQMNVEVKKQKSKESNLVSFPTKLKNGLILPVVVIARSGPGLNSSTNLLLIVLSVVEGTFQYGSMILSLVLLCIIFRRWRALIKACCVHRVAVSPSISLKQRPIITNVSDHGKIYSQL